MSASCGVARQVWSPTPPNVRPFAMPLLRDLDRLDQVEGLALGSGSTVGAEPHLGQRNGHNCIIRYTALAQPLHVHVRDLTLRKDALSITVADLVNSSAAATTWPQSGTQTQ